MPHIQKIFLITERSIGYAGLEREIATISVSNSICYIAHAAGNKLHAFISFNLLNSSLSQVLLSCINSLRKRRHVRRIVELCYIPARKDVIKVFIIIRTPLTCYLYSVCVSILFFMAIFLLSSLSFKPLSHPPKKRWIFSLSIAGLNILGNSLMSSLYQSPNLNQSVKAKETVRRDWVMELKYDCRDPTYEYWWKLPEKLEFLSPLYQHIPKDWGFLKLSQPFCSFPSTHILDPFHPAKCLDEQWPSFSYNSKTSFLTSKPHYQPIAPRYQQGHLTCSFNAIYPRQIHDPLLLTSSVVRYIRNVLLNNGMISQFMN